MCCALWFALRRHCLIWSSESKELGAIFIPDFTEDESAAQVGKVTEVTQLASGRSRNWTQWCPIRQCVFVMYTWYERTGPLRPGGHLLCRGSVHFKLWILSNNDPLAFIYSSDPKRMFLGWCMPNGLLRLVLRLVSKTAVRYSILIPVSERPKSNANDFYYNLNKKKTYH